MFHRWFLRFVFAAMTKRVIQGVRVGILLPNRAERGVMFPKIAEAFDLLARHDPRRLARFQKDVAQVAVELTVSGCGEWVSSVRRVRLDFEYVKAATTTPLHVAATLVHEGTHARLNRLGFAYREAQRSRIEAVCFRSEISFLRRVPGAEALIEDAERQLARDPEYLTNAAFLDRQVATLRQVRMPEFLIRRFLRKRQVPSEHPPQRRTAV